MTKVFWLFHFNFILGIFLMDNPCFLLVPLLMIVQARWAPRRSQFTLPFLRALLILYHAWLTHNSGSSDLLHKRCWNAMRWRSHTTDGSPENQFYVLDLGLASPTGNARAGKQMCSWDTTEKLNRNCQETAVGHGHVHCFMDCKVMFAE